MADKSKNIKEQMFVWLSKEIYDADQKGVKVTVDGSFYSPADVGRLQNVMENHYYMKSYTSDDSGRIVQIDFDQITSM